MPAPLPSIPSPFSLAPPPLTHPPPVALNPLSGWTESHSGVDREREELLGGPDGSLWYAGERGLSGGLGGAPDGAEHYEDGPVPVRHRRGRPAAAGAGGAAALPVGGALP